MDKNNEQAGDAWLNYIKQFSKLEEIFNSIPEPANILLRQHIDIFAGKHPVTHTPETTTQSIEDAAEDDDIDYKFINYNRNDEGIDIWIRDNAPIRLEDCYELSRLAEQLNLLNKKIWEEPF